eukprot:TRINITY_DN1516_c0_g1_i1.p1 TRINITY_DN1516_c0_g1~~TRINITY_DN1516_c0_g1_i1.p1  ORF type:complete len:295 (-),score=35.09 TRINITY_DN1516_c0_g1_i1:43-885(-)
MAMTCRCMSLLGALLLAAGSKLDAPKKTYLRLTQDERTTGDWAGSNRSWQQAAARHGVVVARVPSDPIDWLEQLLAVDVHLFIYTLPGDNEAAALASKHKDQVTINDQVPDTSREAGEFIDFIIQAYDKLPDRVAFAQGHNGAWHDPREDKAQTVLRLLKQDSRKMVHFPGRHVCGSMVIDHKRVSTELWGRYFQKELGNYPLGWPSGYSTPCCSQFVTTRDAIRAHPVSFYEDLYKWMTSGAQDNHIKNGGNPAYHQAQLMEAMWSYIFEHQRGACNYH